MNSLEVINTYYQKTRNSLEILFRDSNWCLLNLITGIQLLVPVSLLASRRCYLISVLVLLVLITTTLYYGSCIYYGFYNSCTMQKIDMFFVALLGSYTMYNYRGIYKIFLLIAVIYIVEKILLLNNNYSPEGECLCSIHSVIHFLACLGFYKISDYIQRIKTIEILIPSAIALAISLNYAHRIKNK